MNVRSKVEKVLKGGVYEAMNYEDMDDGTQAEIDDNF
jgi:hypothetical protein